MFKIYLIYNKVSDAEKNLQQIYVNMLEEYAKKNNGEIYDKVLKKKVKIKDILKEKKKYSPYVVLGKNAKTKKENLDSGYTTAWDLVTNLIDGRFAITKPEGELLNEVLSDEESESIADLLSEIEKIT